MSNPTRVEGKRPILILGASGQVGRALASLLGEGAVALSRTEADLSRPRSLASILEARRPQAVINAAAYTQVDQAEKEEALARVINGEAPGALARWSAAQGIPLVHFSTDYVFS